jgi:hypothetical protein
MNAKTKNIIFHLSGISLYLFIFSIVYLFDKQFIIRNQDTNNDLIIPVFIISILVIACFVFILAAINGIAIRDAHKYNITKYPFYLFVKKDIKWIYHSELGYFLSIIKNDKIIIYDQKYFCREELIDYRIVNKKTTPITLSKDIKDYLDRLYLERLDDIRKLKEQNDKIEEFKKWDGFLDVVGRRDGKIDQLLK